MQKTGGARVTLNIPNKLLEEIRAVATLEELTVTDVFRRALVTEVFLTKSENEGSKVLLEKKDGTFMQVFRPH